MFKEKRVRNSELLQIFLLDTLYSLSGSEKIFFQGGTALRWVYGGMRFSGDLDFVTHLAIKDIHKIVFFETLKQDHRPEITKTVLRDLPSIAGLISSGKLIMPYSSSIILTETPEEILAGKIRAIYERNYLKGRDIYDIWWLTEQLKVKTSWDRTRAKFTMYETDFLPARGSEYFQKKKQ